MTNPERTKPVAKAQSVDAHPVSDHRTPAEIAKDEAGPVGPAVEPSRDQYGAPPPMTPTTELKQVRAAVQRSAHPLAAEKGARSGRRTTERTGRGRSRKP